MIENPDLMAAIIAAPDDDGARLIYADWLDDQGEFSRAEFIRIQIQLAKIDDLHPDYPALSSRELELYREATDWKIPGLRARQEFHRGFVDYVWLRGDRLKNDSNRIADAGTVTRLRISGAERADLQGATPALISRIRELDFTNNSRVRYLISEWFDLHPTTNLNSLILRNVRFWSDDLQAILEMDNFPKLQKLDISGNPLGDEGPNVMANTNKLSGLNELIFRSDGLDASDTMRAAGFASLANRVSLPVLEYLDVSGHNPGGNGLISIMLSQNSINLKFLALPIKGFGANEPDWIETLTGDNYLDNLNRLNFNGYFQSNAECQRIMIWSKLQGQSQFRLDLRKMTLDESEIEIIRSSLNNRQVFFE